MAYLFHGYGQSQLRVSSSFNQQLEEWDTSHVTDMQFMFRSASVFNQDLNHWDTAHVTSLSYMFENAPSFHQTLDGWNTSRVQSMVCIFSGAYNHTLDDLDASGMTVCPTWAVGKITSGPCEEQHTFIGRPDLLLLITSVLAIVTILVVVLYSRSTRSTSFHLSSGDVSNIGRMEYLPCQASECDLQ